MPGRLSWRRCALGASAGVGRPRGSGGLAQVGAGWPPLARGGCWAVVGPGQRLRPPPPHARPFRRGPHRAPCAPVPGRMAWARAELRTQTTSGHRRV